MVDIATLAVDLSDHVRIITQARTSACRIALDTHIRPYDLYLSVTRCSSVKLGNTYSDVVQTFINVANLLVLRLADGWLLASGFQCRIMGFLGAHG